MVRISGGRPSTPSMVSPSLCRWISSQPLRQQAEQMPVTVPHRQRRARAASTIDPPNVRRAGSSASQSSRAGATDESTKPRIASRSAAGIGSAVYSDRLLRRVTRWPDVGRDSTVAPGARTTVAIAIPTTCRAPPAARLRSRLLQRRARSPALLFVHDGPGMPEYWLAKRYPDSAPRPRHRRVVGTSAEPVSPSIRVFRRRALTAAQFVADTLEVTHYLLERFDQEKIYLMGHSWGGYIGIQAVDQAPEALPRLHRRWDRSPTSSNIGGVGIPTYARAYYHHIGDHRMLRRLDGAPQGLLPV